MLDLSSIFFIFFCYHRLGVRLFVSVFFYIPNPKDNNSFLSELYVSWLLFDVWSDVHRLVLFSPYNTCSIAGTVRGDHQDKFVISLVGFSRTEKRWLKKNLFLDLIFLEKVLLFWIETKEILSDNPSYISLQKRPSRASLAALILDETSEKISCLSVQSDSRYNFFAFCRWRLFSFSLQALKR